jgi:hypothetical protein
MYPYSLQPIQPTTRIDSSPATTSFRSYQPNLSLSIVAGLDRVGKVVRSSGGFPFADVPHARKSGSVQARVSAHS